MSETVSVVLLTTAAVANLLKPLIEAGDCQIKKNGEQIMFILSEGSAKISVSVVPHPEIENDAMVRIVAPFAVVQELEKVDSKLLAEMLSMNAQFGSFAFVYDKQSNLLGLQGTLIGSTMDRLEFEYLFISLAKAADALDDKLLVALGGEEVSDGLIKMSKEILQILDDRAPKIVTEFLQTLDESARTEFEKLSGDDEIRSAMREIAFGVPAAKLTAVLLAQNLSDADRKSLANQILESVPDQELLLTLLAFVMTSTALALADAAGVDAETVQARIKTVFGGN